MKHPEYSQGKVEKTVEQNSKLQLWLDNTIHNRIKVLANKQGRTVAELVREALVKILKEYD
jgi:predicted DNA-binding protein